MNAGDKKNGKYSRKSCSWLAEKDEQPPSNRASNSKAGEPAKGRQCGEHRAGQPAGRGLRQPHTGRVLNLKENKNSLSKKFSHPPPINFLPKTRGRVYPVTSNLYQQFSVT